MKFILKMIINAGTGNIRAMKLAALHDKRTGEKRSFKTNRSVHVIRCHDEMPQLHNINKLNQPISHVRKFKMCGCFYKDTKEIVNVICLCDTHASKRESEFTTTPVV